MSVVEIRFLYSVRGVIFFRSNFPGSHESSHPVTFVILCGI